MINDGMILRAARIMLQVLPISTEELRTARLLLAIRTSDTGPEMVKKIRRIQSCQK